MGERLQSNLTRHRQWGLIPHWTKFPPTGPLNTINARSEALMYGSQKCIELTSATPLPVACGTRSRDTSVA